MRIDVRSSRLTLSPTLVQLFRRRVAAALRPQAARIDGILVHVEANDEQHSDEWRWCRISSRADWGRDQAEASGPDLFSAVQLALGKLTQAVNQRATRQRAA